VLVLFSAQAAFCSLRLLFAVLNGLSACNNVIKISIQCIMKCSLWSLNFIRAIFRKPVHQNQPGNSAQENNSLLVKVFEIKATGKYIYRCVLSGNENEVIFSRRLTLLICGKVKYKVKKRNSVAWVRDLLYRPSDRRLSAKLVPTFAERVCHVVRVTNPYGRIPGFLDRSRYFFFKVAPQLYSRGWVDPVPDPLLLWKSCSAGNRTWTSGSVGRNPDH
jgi:hypothetical protein